MNAPAWVIRDEAPADHESVDGLMAALQEHELGLSDDRLPGADMAAKHMRYLREDCAAKQGRVLVAEMDGLVSGVLVVMVERVDEGDVHLLPRFRAVGEITDLYVTEACRGLGIARGLLAAAERHCRALGLSRIRLSVLSGNRHAREIYRQAGYREQDIICNKAL